MTKTMIGFFLFGCGSSGADFLSTSAELDGGVDARAVMGVGGSSGGGGRSASAGGAVNSGGRGSGGYDTRCGPRPICAELDFRLHGAEDMTCETEADCCHGIRCVSGKCQLYLGAPLCTPATEAEDCPCGWTCTQQNNGMGTDGGHFCLPVAPP